MASGIYCLQSKIKPERIYIGSSNNIDNRKRQHLNDLKRNIHHSAKIQNHVNKYGGDDLEFFTVMECAVDQLVKNEQFYIDILNPFFNSRRIANSNSGVKYDERIIRKMSERTKKRFMDNPKLIDSARLLSKERWNDDEYRNTVTSKIRERCLDEDYRKKLSESHMGLGWSEKRYISDAKMVKTKGSSMYWGVTFDKKEKKYKASVTLNSKTKQLGTFNSEIEAVIGREHYILFNGMEYQKLNHVSSSGR